MKNDRLRSPVTSEYAEALGRAAYTFASLEWQVVWSCERLKQGSLNGIVENSLTAGKISKVFIDLSRNMPKSAIRTELQEIARKFSTLVLLRNEILHGKPCTAPNGDQQLSGKKVITIPALEAAADQFVEWGAKLNAIYYDFLIKDAS